jgi:hypothetical protein
MAHIKVSHLGKIADAEFTIAPLNILVGRNNTGKTYAANLIWAICNIHLLSDSARKGRRSLWLSEFLKPLTNLERRTHILTVTDTKRIFNAGLKDISSKFPAFLARVFAFDGFDGTTIDITPEEFVEFELSVVPNVDDTATLDDATVFNYSVKIGDNNIRIASYPAYFVDQYNSFVYDRIYYDVLGLIAFGPSWVLMKNPTYIPAARTGLMLSLSSFVDNAMEFASTGDKIQDLPLPLTYFLRRMQRNAARARQTNLPSQELVIERMLDGQITSKRGAVREYRYKPNGIDTSLPLHAVSSMITELAPLIIDMRSFGATRHIIFEEPEAHLHLEAQRDMARVIARLVSEGTYVTITTHSDTFLQQINNLMKLHSHPRKVELLKKFDYDPEDVINPKLVRAYEFCPANGGTTVRAVRQSEEGFIVPTLNSTLLALARETVELRSGL